MMSSTMHGLHTNLSVPGKPLLFGIHSYRLTTQPNPTNYPSPPPSKLSLTHRRHLLLNPFKSVLNNLAASTFAGLSSLGLLSMLMTLSRIVSGVWTGDQRSEADS